MGKDYHSNYSLYDVKKREVRFRVLLHPLLALHSSTLAMNRDSERIFL